MRYSELLEGAQGALPDGLKLEIEPGQLEGCWSITASLDGKEVGSLSLGPNRHDENAWSAMNVWVDALYRRQGIAAAMYSFAHKKGIKPLVPDTKLSKDGEAFWGKHLQPTYTSGFKARYPKREWNPRRAKR